MYVGVTQGERGTFREKETIIPKGVAGGELEKEGGASVLGGEDGTSYG